MADQMRQWLDQHGLGRYAKAFAENDIDLDVLSDLSDVDLRELGVTLGDRKRLLKAVRDEPTEAPEPPQTEDATAAGDGRPISPPITAQPPQAGEGVHR